MRKSRPRSTTKQLISAVIILFLLFRFFVVFGLFFFFCHHLRVHAVPSVVINPSVVVSGCDCHRKRDKSEHVREMRYKTYEAKNDNFHISAFDGAGVSRQQPQQQQQQHSQTDCNMQLDVCLSLT